jgi:hypothetical protein
VPVLHILLVCVSPIVRVKLASDLCGLNVVVSKQRKRLLIIPNFILV